MRFLALLGMIRSADRRVRNTRDIAGQMMTYLSKIVLLCGALLLAGCGGGGVFGNGGGVFGGGGTGAGAGGGSLSDPTSPVYFQEAIGDRVFFVVDESTLTGAAKETLDAQARWLMENPEFNALIEGHADEQGTREYNLALGARRANAAQEYLISRGVAPGRLDVVSYGKERPVEICSDESCYAKNRRAVTVISAVPAG